MREVRIGLKENPQDLQLKALDELLTKRVNSPVNPADLDRQIQALIGGRGGPSADGPGRPAAMGQAAAMNFAKPSAAGEPASRFKAQSSRAPLRTAYDRLDVGDYTGAESYLTDRIHANPSDWQSYRLRAIARLRLKNFAGAAEDAKGALNINRRDVAMLNALGLSLAQEGRFQEALPILRESLDLSPKDAGTYRTRAKAWRLMGEAAKELSDLGEAARFDPRLKGLYEEALDERRGRPGLLRGPISRTLAAFLAASCLLAALIVLGFVLRRPVPYIAPLEAFPAAALETPAPAAPAALTPGARFGDFEIVRTLGRGGMGVVYEAMDVLLRRPVAVKRMREEIAQDAREKKRFTKEARIVASLDHPHIVRIHSVLDRPDGLYLIFEFVPGDSVDRLLDRERRLPFKEVLRLLKAVGRALDYAHRRGVIHRDLKPANIMVSSEGVAKVMDFGIAWRARETAYRLGGKETTTGAVGTPLYMAPEQSWGECVRESDLYALGVCCYEMLTGSAPFDGPHPQQQKMEKMFTPVSRLLRQAPEALDRILDRAMDPVHARRFHSAEEFVGALEAVLPAESLNPS